MYNMYMRRASIAEARADFSALVDAVANSQERVILTSHGKPKAALVPLRDLEAVEDLVDEEGANESSLSDVRRLHARILAWRGGVPLPDSMIDLDAIREESSTHI